MCHTMKALRTFIFMMLVTVSLQVAAQSMVEKWNDFYKRSEFYDSHGKLLGWKNLQALGILRQPWTNDKVR